MDCGTHGRTHSSFKLLHLHRHHHHHKNHKNNNDLPSFIKQGWTAGLASPGTEENRRKPKKRDGFGCRDVPRRKAGELNKSPTNETLAGERSGTNCSARQGEHPIYRIRQWSGGPVEARAGRVSSVRALRCPTSIPLSPSETRRRARKRRSSLLREPGRACVRARPSRPRRQGRGSSLPSRLMLST